MAGVRGGGTRGTGGLCETRLETYWRIWDVEGDASIRAPGAGIGLQGLMCFLSKGEEDERACVK